MTEDSPRVDRETAADDFDRFAKAARIKMSRNRNTNDARDLKEDRERFIEEVMDGRIVVDDGGTVTVICENDALKEVKFPLRVNAMALAAADRRKKGEDTGKLNAMMAVATGNTPGHIEQLDVPDWTNVALVFGLFLAG